MRLTPAPPRPRNHGPTQSAQPRVVAHRVQNDKAAANSLKIQPLVVADYQLRSSDQVIVLRGSMDTAFLEDLYRRYSRSVFRRASSLVGDGDLGKDLMQEVFLRAFEARAEFTSATSPLSWLYRITTNICLNRLRDSRRRRDILKVAFGADELVARPTSDAMLTVRAVLDRVPEEVQEIAVYYFVDQMSQEEISVVMSIPRRTVSYRIEQFRSLALAAAQDKELAS
jgi:RNA polymerase sigma-70 factor, ECF subfamily